MKKSEFFSEEFLKKRRRIRQQRGLWLKDDPVLKAHRDEKERDRPRVNDVKPMLSRKRKGKKKKRKGYRVRDSINPFVKDVNVSGWGNFF